MENNNLELKLKHCKEKLGWVCDNHGNVINRSGKIIGSVDENGYKKSLIVIDGKAMNIKMHQYIWFWFKGEVPTIIDHINQVKHDNRIENLRIVTKQQNCWNNSANGYSFHILKNKWQASIRVDGVLKHLGLFGTKEEARQAYLDAKAIWHKID